MRLHLNKRRGTTAVESAIVLPVVLSILLAILAGALAVASYQECAAIAREAARYASVHGQNYQEATGKPAATAQDVYDNAIKTRFATIDPANLTYSVTWSPDNRQGSFVTVTLTYQMSVPIYGTMTFSSTSTAEVAW